MFDLVCRSCGGGGTVVVAVTGGEDEIGGIEDVEDACGENKPRESVPVAANVGRGPLWSGGVCGWCPVGKWHRYVFSCRSFGFGGGFCGR